MKLHSSFVRVVGSILIFSHLLLPNTRAAQASMISTESFLAGQVQTTPRDRVLNLLQKEEVLMKLQELGVSPIEARERIASLSDQEILKINAKMDQLPAGADDAGAIIGTAFAVFIILLITDILCLTKIFHFTRCAGR